MPYQLIQQHNLNFFNIKDKGADPTGATDSTTAIQAVINTAPVGAIIFFPPGTYLVSSTIILVGKLAYISTTGSYGGATIKQKNGSNLPAVMASYEWYNNSSTSGEPVRIENIIVDANWANNTTSHGIVLMNYNSIIRECLVINTPACGIINSSVSRNGTSISNTAVENRIEACKVDNVGQHGIYIQDNNGKITDGYIDSCIVSNTVHDGIRVDRSAGYFVQNNHVYGVAMNGYALSNCWSTFIMGNEVDGYGTSNTADYYSGIGISLIGPRATVIEGNIIATNYESNNASTYQHLSITGSGSTDTKAIVVGNAIIGGYVATSSTTSLVSGAKTPCTPASMNGIFAGQLLTVAGENITVASITSTTFTPTANWAGNHGPTIYYITSNKSQGLSTGITYQSNGTQTSSGQPCTIVSYGNRVENVGHYSYFDSYTTVGPVGIDGAIALSQTPNYAIPTLSNGNTITTLGLGSIVVTASSNVTGIILQTGTQSGQIIVINNEGAGDIAFASSSSNVADAANNIIPGYGCEMFVWDSTAFLWYGSRGTVFARESTSAAVITNSATITTANIDEARVAPSGNVTGIIMQAGTRPAQTCLVVNESAFTITFNTTPGTSNVAGSAADPAIPAKCCRLFKWDSTTSFWYRAA